MIGNFVKQLLSIGLSFLMVIIAVPFEAGAQQPAQPGPTGYSGPGAPLSAAELQQLAAPVALYPDALVAQILGAATFPDQIAAADDWLQQNKSLTGTALMTAVDAQPWDPGVKALTQFPAVLDNMAKNLAWTSSLGEAYHLQAADVMTAVQVLRAQAQAAGNLKSGSQITVVQQAPQVIVIQPTNPQVVYVPMYNYAVVYGTPYVVPYYPPPPPAAAVFAFGVGIAVGIAMSNSWGYSYWNCNWHGGTVVYRSGSYYGNPAWHGGYYAPRPVPYGTTVKTGAAYNPSTGTVARGASVSTPYGTAAAGKAYNPSTGTVARGASVSNAYGTTAAGQAYNPNTGAYAATHQTANAYGSAGSSVYSKNGNTAYTQHQTTAQGSVGSVQTSSGAKGAAATGANGNSAAVGKTANGDKYASANGNVYKNTGSGWNQTQGSSSAASRGYTQPKTSGASAYSGNGFQSQADSARGSASRGSARRQ